MTHWTSPFPLPAALGQMLEGLAPDGALPFAPFNWPAEGRLLLFYASPVTLLAAGALSPSPGQPPISTDELLSGYQAVAQLHQEALERSFDLVLLAADQLVPADLQAWLGEGTVPEVMLDLPVPSALEALLALRAVEQIPSLLDAYLDLELKAELIGREPDLECRQHWQQLAAIEALLQDCHQMASARLERERTNGDLATARQEAELTLELLHQVQEELEHYFLLSGQQKEQLSDLSASHEQLASQRDHAARELEQLKQEQTQLETQIIRTNGDLATARQEAELTVQQLHQVQEELEHYFLLSRRQKEQLSRHELAGARSRSLLSTLMHRLESSQPAQL